MSKKIDIIFLHILYPFVLMEDENKKGLENKTNTEKEIDTCMVDDPPDNIIDDINKTINETIDNIILIQTETDNKVVNNISISETQNKILMYLEKLPELEVAFLKELETKTIDNLKHMKGIILHKGKPNGQHECSKCRSMKENVHFKYYNKRVDKKDCLMRVNALCIDCSELTNAERKSTLNKATLNGEIDDKPLAGDICPNCKRKWGTEENPRNWHRDHDAIKNVFRGWLCGDCNMAKHDHRHGIS